ncbi:MAG: DNA-protecting protein DprA [Gemmatimonadetes bacterium]|nr:DNA-protecting protein DprA [Gemmatimonadota bacterium]
MAIVGSRRPTREGRAFAERLAADLAQRGVVVVSGMAYGIDAAAHRGALETGRTVAVLASGADLPSPTGNRALYRAIVERGGAVVSEYPPGMPALAHHFRKRNRIVSGLALGTVVVEAGEHSGALVTARHAMDQNREVFAVPGSPLHETTAGSNALLRDGAALVRDWLDVVCELAAGCPALAALARGGTPPALPQEDAGVRLARHLGRSPKHVDQLQRECGWSVAELLAELTELEMRGLARQHAGSYFSLA